MGYARIYVDAEREPTIRERVDSIMDQLANSPDTRGLFGPAERDNRHDQDMLPPVDAGKLGPIYEQLGISPSDRTSDMADWQTQAIASLPHTHAAKIGVFAANRFPDLRPEQAIGRYGVMGDRIFYIDRDGQPKWEEPRLGTSLLSPDRYLGSVVGPNIGPIGAAIGGAVGGIPGAAVGAGTGDFLRQYLAAQLAHEQMSPAERIAHLGLEAAAGAGGRFAGDKIAPFASQVLSPYAPVLGRYAGGWATQQVLRKAANKTAFHFSRALQDQLGDLNGLDAPEPPWLGIPW